MPLMKLYFTPVLLLLALSCPAWVVSRSLPPMPNGQMTGSCVFYARTLLENITNLLTRMFSGMNCTRHNMELNLKTRTPTVCSPQGSVCSGETTSAFDRETCMSDIGKDLSHYYKVLSALPDSDGTLGSSVLLPLKELMEVCQSLSPVLNDAFVFLQASVGHSSANGFNQRQRLCKIMKGFQVRTITINRAIGYMSLGEHTN
uniref:Interleukin-12 subunit alpha n=1 Tax=Xiphophorus couchianus TaxID=32473 RepID=A0A3B5KR56_9TELE